MGVAVIIQTFLNFFAGLVQAWLYGLPPLPDSFFTMRTWFQQLGNWLTDHVAVLGAVVPWATFETILSVWVGLLVFWVGMLALRVVMWAINR